MQMIEELEVSDKERADCNMACLLHLVGFIERGEWEEAKDYAQYVRAMLRLIEFSKKVGV